MRINIWLFILVFVIACNNTTPSNKLKPAKKQPEALLLTPPKLKTGDIVFQQSYSNQSKAIALATHSKYSHIGLVIETDTGMVVYEAVQPVKISTVQNFKNSSKDSVFAVKRLINTSKLTVENSNKLNAYLNAQIGKNYDILFNWNDKEMYCSELVWKAYAEIGIELCKPRPLKDYDLNSEEVQGIISIRYKENIPYDEPMVAPVDIYHSKLLKTIYEYK